ADDAGFGWVDAISITVFYAPPSCGDGLVNDAAEQCDDGNNVDGDCCSSICQFEAPGSLCGDGDVCNGQESCDGAGTCVPGMPIGCICGNNVIDPNEDCDDGNTVNGDCCSATCQLDPAGYPCADNTVCNGDETCDGSGVCQPGTALNCDDHNLCTQDSCNPITGCVNDSSPIGGCR